MEIPNFFGNGMVLQRDVPNKIWGISNPGESVQISFFGKSYLATADTKGNWQIVLEPKGAGGPYSMKIVGDETIEFENIMIGEVWLCSGQSNMEWSFHQSLDYDKDLPLCENPNIRLLKVARKASIYPESNVSGSWSECNKKSIKDFSAVGYYFGKKLFEELNVPIGLIGTSWGGTTAQAWTSKEGLQSHAKLSKYLEDIQFSLEMNTDELKAHRQSERKVFLDALPQDEGNKGLGLNWHKIDFDDSLWGDMNIPSYWVNEGQHTNGVFWFRKSIDIPNEWNGENLTLSLGTVDKSDDTYFNGQLIGGLKWADNESSWNTRRFYEIPASLVKKEKNVISVRVMSNYTGGGICGVPEDLFIKKASDKNDSFVKSIIGKWKFKIEQDFGRVPARAEPSGFAEHTVPSSLFNGMIAPLIPIAMRGFIWYQGESNSGDAERYKYLFPAMINDWRKKWGNEFPFYFVQLANFARGGPVLDFDNLEWPPLREAQMAALDLKNTGYAITIDIGEPLDIHPKNKKEVGLRLAYNALAQTYSRETPFQGPVFKEFSVNGPEMIVKFLHADGLNSTVEQIRSFVIAGEDKVFYEAKAVIHGEEIVLTSPQVKAPVAVRYAWANSPSCSLYNNVPLPAVPFRSDNWPL